MARKSVSWAAGLLLVVAVSAFAQVPQPAAMRPVIDNHHGETLTDPYRWMEGMGPEFMAWIKAQDAATRAFFASMPGYAAFRAEERTAYRSEVALRNFQLVDDQLYFERQAASAAQPSLYVRPLAGGPERMVADPVALAGPTANITFYAPSPDNHYLIYAMATGGSEETSLHLVDLRTGRTLPEVIDRARQAAPSWSADSEVVFYTRMKATFADPADRFRDLTVLEHRPGDALEHDRVVATGVGLASCFGRAAWVTVQGEPRSDYLLAQANSGVSLASEWYVAKRVDLDRAGQAAWRR